MIIGLLIVVALIVVLTAAANPSGSTNARVVGTMIFLTLCVAALAYL